MKLISFAAIPSDNSHTFPLQELRRITEEQPSQKQQVTEIRAWKTA